MKPFKFRLESLLDFRRNIEDLLKREFSVSRKELDEKEKELDKLVDYYAKEIEAMIQKGEFTALEINMFRDHLMRLKDNMENRGKVVKSLKDKVQKWQNKLVAAVRERKVLDFLREMDYKEYKKSESRNEQFQIDEYNSNNYNPIHADLKRGKGNL